jgi:small subunit ribosomal protein S20
MPNKKSAKKELRGSIKRNAENKKVSNRLKKADKSNLKQIEAKDKKVVESIPNTIKAIDKAAKKGIIKKNTASRKKSKLMKKVNSLAK